MAEPTWKKLVDQLKDQQHESPYLDRLRQRLPASGPSGGRRRRPGAQRCRGKSGREANRHDAKGAKKPGK
ncbi:hypothetical protein WMF31_36790 [Sorangium sp. So ce1036]|uniref:hypothetical protein n=1 Tax=Sorangium sp. So ce1036 TaxID=3133328 RepID=UPI003F0F59DC